ncbi:MAG: glycine C-acetyltransferase [Candidatus Coatesbacteria bacterium]|nr:glycine C-acetyltransferase [Candidatus Coatesbacteria bacterium]
MYGKIKQNLTEELKKIREAGLYKEERIIQSKQGAEIEVNGKKVLNFCMNNYLGLANHPRVLKGAKEALKRWGYGMSSVRFICGTQEQHKELEAKISRFLGTEDTILYSSCFDANGGVFEQILDADCAILADALNHASIIDGVRLCKAKRFIYLHDNMNDLEEKLKSDEVRNAKYRLIATDGVFSMDGDIAQVDKICDLADKYDALVMVDDSHATGFVGSTGRGSHEYRKCIGRVDLITTTFGKALGGASGGCTSGRKELVEWLRQKSRPYLFSNTLAPAVVGGTIAVMDMLSETSKLVKKVQNNTKYFRKQMTKAGFAIRPGTHPIVPIMFGQYDNDAKLAQDFARDLLPEGIYVIAFSFPVVPKGQARIRVQISAAHSRKDLDKAIEAFTKIGKKYNILKK